MLYFSKFRIISVILISLFFILIASSNLFKFENNLLNKKINLGLDLQGGSYLLLEIDNNPVIEQKIQNLSITIRNYFKDKNIRIKNLKILGQKLSFSVDENFKQTILDTFNDEESELNPYYPRFKSHQLDITEENNIFFVNYSTQGIVKLKTSSQDQALEIVRRRIDEIGTNEPNILKRGNDRILVELPGLDDPMRIKSLLGKTANLTFRFVTNNDQDSFGAEKLSYEDESEEDALVSKRIILSGDNLLDAAPVIRDTIASGSGQISGGFTFQSATDLALLLRSGALPAPLNIIEERTVGPDLGQDSINAGMIALAIGFVLVIVFIFVKYKIFGLITNITLILNLFLLIGILTIFEATLTLPGIAGIILTVGMAVDANVLIFERIKEELKNEKNNLIAFDSGYTKSRTAILDANITTLLAAIILFFMGSGPIKGFSLTLGIGIFTTLFSVYFIARLLTVLYVYRNKEKEGLI